VSIAAEANRKFLNTSVPRSAIDWDALLAHQVDVVFPQELELLLTLPAWQGARRVLDAGCGNGYYLSRVRDFFPNKEYAGVDISPELIARARRRYSGIGFAVSDLADHRPKERYDIVIMRFLVQHLKDFGQALGAADRLLDRDGRLLIIESDLANSAHRPDLTLFTRMLYAFADASFATGAVKQRLLADPATLIAHTNPAWQVEEQRAVTSPHLGPFGGTKLLTIYLLWVDLCESSAMFDFEFGAVRDELHDWATDPVSFSKIGLRSIVVKRG
jgi:SAM-dependent methyltransferase